MVASPQGQTYVDVGITLTILATVAVITRFISRWKKDLAAGADDYWICVALVFAYGMLGEGIICQFSTYLSTLLRPPLATRFHLIRMNTRGKGWRDGKTIPKSDAKRTEDILEGKQPPTR